MAQASQSLERSEAGRAFLQHRVARYGLIGSGFGWFFVAFRLVQAISHGHIERELANPSLLLHILGAFSLFALWLACRRGSHTVAWVRAVEVTALLLAAAFYSAMGMYIPLVAYPHDTVLLALSFGLMARAVYVPSSARRTLLVTGLSGIPLLAVTWLMWRTADITLWIEVFPELKDETAHGVASGLTLYTAAWWLCALALCVAASRVIYGLRKQVRDVRKLGQYTLAEKLGEGGMGVVYRASHAMLRRPTAVKLLPAEKAGESSVARFEKEVQLTAMLTHPNTVTVFDFGRTPDGIFYYAMELLDGPTLSDVVALDGSQPAARVVHILVQAAGALAEAHGVGLIHRDIKPQNIMLVRQGGEPDVAKVLDFGLVKELEVADAEAVGLTGANILTGTPLYMAPEAITAPESVGAASDLYALAAVGYFLLTGNHVFAGRTVVEVCGAHLHNVPTPPSVRLGKAVPLDLERLLLACLAKDPADRPASAAELQTALRECTGIGTWTDAEARRWWDRRSAAIGRPAPPSIQTALTLDVDLAARG